MDGPFFTAIPDWLATHRGIITGVTISSLVLFVLTPVAVPFLLIRMPPDALVRRPVSRADRSIGYRLAGWSWMVVRNILGIALVLLGFVMLFIPGQGLLTILAGIALADVPGKRTLIIKIVSRPAIRRGIENLRARRGRPPLIIPD